MEHEIENILENLVRIGTVSAVDAAKKKARVTYPGRDDIVSGWLQVIQRIGTSVNVIPDGAHTHEIRDTYSSGGSASTESAHSHGGTTADEWMPKVNDTVLTLYLPVRDGDGFILGVI